MRWQTRPRDNQGLDCPACHEVKSTNVVTVPIKLARNSVLISLHDLVKVVRLRNDKTLNMRKEKCAYITNLVRHSINMSRGHMRYYPGTLSGIFSSLQFLNDKFKYPVRIVPREHHEHKQGRCLTENILQVIAIV